MWPAVIISISAPELVLEPTPRTGGVINNEPLFITAVRRRDGCPRLPARQRLPQVVKKVLQKTEVEKSAGIVRIQDRIATENVGLQNARRIPVFAAISRIREAGLAKVRRDGIELSPTDAHIVSVGRINANGRLIGSVADPVVAIRIHVDLIARVRTELRQ